MFDRDTFRRAKYENGIEYNKYGQDIKTRTKDLISEMQAKLSKVATILKWGIKPLDMERTREGLIIMTPFDGSEIWFTFLSYPDHSKLHVSATYPKDAKGNSVTARSDDNKTLIQPNISMTCNNTPEQIVKALQSRFLPEHNLYLEGVNKAIQQWNAYHNGIETTKKAISKLLGTDSRRDGTEFYLPGNWPGYGDVRISSASSIDLNLRSLPLDLVTAIIKEIKKHYP